MFVIGLIDDEADQLKKIRLTIKENAIPGVEFSFNSYPITDDMENVVNIVFENVMNDIIESKITSLIIDYKIMVQTIKIKGTDILERIKKEVPKFPIIILTEVVEESMEPDFIDADKVYKKRDFFKIDESYSKEKVFNIFDSMIKYEKQKDSIELSIKSLQEQLVKGTGVREELIFNILELEEQLDEFIPTDQTQIDKVFDTDKIKNIVGLIEQANELLE